MADRLIQEGSKVIAVGRRQDRLDDFVRKNGSDKASAVKFDITNRQNMDEFVKELVNPVPVPLGRCNTKDFNQYLQHHQYVPRFGLHLPQCRGSKPVQPCGASNIRHVRFPLRDRNQLLLLRRSDNEVPTLPHGQENRHWFNVVRLPSRCYRIRSAY